MLSNTVLISYQISNCAARVNCVKKAGPTPFFLWLTAGRAFSALTLLVGWQEGHPACIYMGWWGAGMVICLERGANDLRNGSADATATPSSLASAKSRMVYPSGTGLPTLPGKKAVKRLCVCVWYHCGENCWKLLPRHVLAINRYPPCRITIFVTVLYM